VDCGDAMATVPNELPPVPTVDDGSRTSDAGAGCGVTVTCAGVLTPFQVAVTVAVVVVVTRLSAAGTTPRKPPGLTNTDVGGLTSGELLERPTIAPREAPVREHHNRSSLRAAIDRGGRNRQRLQRRRLTVS